MSRLYLIVVLLILGMGAVAQVVVTNGGYATQSGPAIPATPVSPPVLYAPIVHLESGHVPAANLTANTNGGLAPVAPAVVMPAPLEQAQPGPEASQSAAPQETFRFGAAQFRSYAAFPGTGENLSTGGMSLTEAARRQRQRQQNTNARLYTNADIERLNQANGTISMPSGRGNLANGNWAPDNGVINFNAPPQNSVASPAQPNEPTPGTAAPSPLSPAGIQMSPSQPPGVPQAEAKPSAQRQVEIAENNPDHALPPDQPASGTATFSGTANHSGAAHASTLPRTSSRLPLLGLAGLFSVSMGLFVRYQRAKAK